MHRQFLAITGIMLATLLAGCMEQVEQQEPRQTTQPKYMNIAITGLTAKESGIIDRKVTISCQATNTGDPGWVTIKAYVKYNDQVHDWKDARIHLDSGQQKMVSLEVDIKELGGSYYYGVNYQDPEPD